MNILALIPARGGSKGIPHKNIAPLGGRPLIAYTIAAAKAARGVSRVIVSTDDDAIADTAAQLGADIPFRRPDNIAADASPALPVIEHALAELERLESWRADAVAYLQPTSPFRRGSDIDAAIRLMVETDADTVVSVVRVPHNMTPDSLMTEREGWLDFAVPPEARNFRRQDKARLFARNGPSILLIKRAVIQSRALYGERIKGLEMDRLRSIDIDDHDDLRLAEALLPLALAGKAD